MSLDRILPFMMPIKALLLDTTVTEVMVIRGGQAVFVERSGIIERVQGLVLEPKNLMAGIINIARTCRKEIDTKQPSLDARLEDGSRVAAMIPPCSPDGATLTIRKFSQKYDLATLVAADTLPADEADYLKRAVHDQRNILISGGTGSGKTTILNALAATIPLTDRVVLIEDTSEISMRHDNLVRFESRPAQVKMGTEDPPPPVTIAELLRATLRHRPDRIILGEVRGVEAWDLLQCLNTGHQGSLSTIHANSAKQALMRLSHCVLMAGMGLDPRSVEEAVSMAIHIVVHIVRHEGKRQVAEILAVHGYKEGNFLTDHVYLR